MFHLRARLLFVRLGHAMLISREKWEQRDVRRPSGRAFINSLNFFFWLTFSHLFFIHFFSRTPLKIYSFFFLSFQLEDEGASPPFHPFEVLNKRIGIYSPSSISFPPKFPDFHWTRSFPEADILINFNLKNIYFF